jgi:hypothetical protein
MLCMLRRYWCLLRCVFVHAVRVVQAGMLDKAVSLVKELTSRGLEAGADTYNCILTGLLKVSDTNYVM